MSRRPVDDRDGLLSVAVSGRIAPARIHVDPTAVDSRGRVSLLPGSGGISLGVHVGDLVMSYLADHLMVGLSIEDESETPAVAGPLHQLACLGNRVRDASGTGIGVVAGKRGGLAPGFMPPQLVSVEVPEARQGRLVPGERVVLEAIGRGLSLPDHPDVSLMNLSPDALDGLPLEVTSSGLEVPVRDLVPVTAAGAGVGQDPWIGDVEIADPGALHDPDGLRFGDLVAVTDMDGRVSRFPRIGWVSVGVVAHGPSPVPGHGVGLTLLLSGPDAVLKVRRSSAASLATALAKAASQESDR